MINDAQEVEDGAILEFDLCIVGGGAAGIAIARRFIGGHHRVALLEAGGLEYDDDIQAIYQGTNRGQPYFDLDVCRLRYFGGTTNHWDGRCRPLDPIDFAPRSWVPHSGWPIERAALDPYYALAHEVCQLGPYEYDPEPWLRPGEMILPLDSGQARNRALAVQPADPLRRGLPGRAGASGQCRGAAGGKRGRHRDRCQRPPGRRADRGDPGRPAHHPNGY